MRRLRTQQRERHLRANALNGLQQAEPLALLAACEAEQLDRIFAHLRFDVERRALACHRQVRQNPRRAVHDITNAADIDDGEILANLVNDTRELSDHRMPASFEFMSVFASDQCACVIATASASAASAPSAFDCGSSILTIT